MPEHDVLSLKHQLRYRFHPHCKDADPILRAVYKETKTMILSELYYLCEHPNSTRLKNFFNQPGIKRAFKSALEEIRAQLKRDVTKLSAEEID